MSVAISGTPVTGTFTSGTGLSITAGAGSNRALVLALAHTSSSGGGVPVYTGVQPTFNAINLQQIGSFITNSAARYMCGSMWLMKEASIPSGAQTLVASWSDASNNLNEANALATVWTLTGVDQTTPVTATDSGSTNSATSIAGSGLSATAAGMVLFNGAFNAGSSTGVTGPTGYTQDLATTGFDFSGWGMMGHKAIGSAGTETPTISWTGASAAAILIANFQAVAPASFVPHMNYAFQPTMAM